jgi:hypothetical protein
MPRQQQRGKHRAPRHTHSAASSRRGCGKGVDTLRFGGGRARTLSKCVTPKMVKRTKTTVAVAIHKELGPKGHGLQMRVREYAKRANADVAPETKDFIVDIARVLDMWMKPNKRGFCLSSLVQAIDWWKNGLANGACGLLINRAALPRNISAEATRFLLDHQERVLYFAKDSPVFLNCRIPTSMSLPTSPRARFCEDNDANWHSTELANGVLLADVEQLTFPRVGGAIIKVRALCGWCLDDPITVARTNELSQRNQPRPQVAWWFPQKSHRSASHADARNLSLTTLTPTELIGCDALKPGPLFFSVPMTDFSWSSRTSFHRKRTSMDWIDTTNTQGDRLQYESCHSGQAKTLNLLMTETLRRLMYACRMARPLALVVMQYAFEPGDAWRFP